MDIIELVELIAVVAVVSSLVTEVAFIFCVTCRRLIDSGVWMPIEMLGIAYVGLVLGWIGDALMSQTRGRLEFWELRSCGLLMTHRVQWHVDHPGDWRHERAVTKWAPLLNAISPGHIKGLPAV